MDELRLAIRVSWGKFPLTLSEKFVESMLRRLKAFIRAKEGPTTF